MALVKYAGTAVVKYPYAAADLYDDNPGVYFPDLKNETLASYNAANVVVTGAPEHNPITQAAEPSGCAWSTARQRWETTWAVRDLAADEISTKQKQLEASIVQATQDRLDSFARTRNYDGILSACTYATSAVEKFQVEGQYSVAARDATWAALYDIMAEVQAGTRPVPSGYEDIEADLPELAWPE